jgi:plastocyanin
MAVMFCVFLASCNDEAPGGTNASEVERDVSAEVEQFLSEQVPGGTFNDRGLEIVSGRSATRITLEELAFAPTVLAGRAGQELEVVLVNAGDGPHTFTVDDQGVNVALRRGQNGQAMITIPLGDTPVLFYCRLHRAQGMVGALAHVPAT